MTTQNAPLKLVFSCSGAADVAEIADLAARQLNRQGPGKMYCLAGVGGHVPDIVERTKTATKIVVIDGCEKDCGKHCLRGAGIEFFAHLRVTDLGMEKGKSPVTNERIATVASRAAAALEGDDMWLITNFGFFSVVEKPDQKGSKLLTSRARAKADLEALRKRYIPNMGEIQTGGGTDYKYRAVAPRAAIADAFAQAIRDIDYSNFKSSVAAKQGNDRAHLYHDLWSVLTTVRLSIERIYESLGIVER